VNLIIPKAISQNIFRKAYTKNVNGNFEPFIVSSTWNTRLFTGREYAVKQALLGCDEEIGLYYNRARYYSAQLGRFISRDPIDIADDINLYAYVGNNPVMYVDRMGLEKYLIFYGRDNPWDNSIFLGKEYQKKKLLERWIKESSIIEVPYVQVDVMNKILKWYKWRIQEIIVVAHGDDSKVWNITKWNISELQAINKNACVWTTVNLVSCNTWKGNDSIAQDMSNMLWVNVQAPSAYIWINSINSFIIQFGFPWMLDWFEEIWEPSLYTIYNIENIINGDLKYNYFTPNQ